MTRYGLRWHLRENWSNAWTLGRFEFEIEWLPKARYYTFCFSVKTPERWGKERGLL